jgi:uncharacterized protein YmfQ (DUF2313 family)
MKYYFQHPWSGKVLFFGSISAAKSSARKSALYCEQSISIYNDKGVECIIDTPCLD